MHVEEYGPVADAPPEGSRFRLRSPIDRRCPDCEEVALAFDVETGRARCRSCGTLD